MLPTHNMPVESWNRWYEWFVESWTQCLLKLDQSVSLTKSSQGLWRKLPPSWAQDLWCQFQLILKRQRSSRLPPFWHRRRKAWRLLQETSAVQTYTVNSGGKFSTWPMCSGTDDENSSFLHFSQEGSGNKRPRTLKMVTCFSSAGKPFQGTAGHLRG